MASRPLYQTEAEQRYSQIAQGIKYRYFYVFRQGDNYDGVAELKFTFVGDSDTWIDWNGSSVKGLWINSLPVQDIVFEASRIQLKHELLKKDQENSVWVHFHNLYSNDGDGLVAYTDSDDGKQYLYAQTEPFTGNRVCPLFDQPDLKATFELFAIGDKEWKIITGEQQVEESTFEEFLVKTTESGDDQGFIDLAKATFANENKEFKFFRFRVTRSLSSYLNNIVAGPYARFDCPADQQYKNIPMAVYCRQSMTEFALAGLGDIFAYHAKGIEFYEKLFNFDYPFSKCDAIFCCNYSSGAMEYPGAITYNESIYLKKKLKLSKFEKSNRGRVIFHELAHMWFGNTVTMKWWNGLWLNESFADFCCFECWGATGENLPFEIANPWIAFLKRKGWAFVEDQERTTHPIAAEVENTDAAISIFDGITYPKGAMVMRQLMILLSKETFSKALGNYFQKYAWKNTLLSDLLDACKETVGSEISHPAYDIDKWKEAWLDSPGMNSITSEWSLGATGEQTLRVIQSAANPDFPTLRYHKCCVAFFGEDGKIIEEKEVILNNQEVTEITYNGDTQPKGIFLNYKDWTFIKIVFDHESKKFFTNNYFSLDNLSRCLFIRSLYDQVRDATMPAKDFIELASELMKKDTDSESLTYTTEILAIVVSRFTTPEEYPALTSKLFKIAVERLLTTDDFDTISSLKVALFAFLFTEEDIEIAKQYYEETHELKKHSLSINEKWNIVSLIAVSSKYSQDEKDSIISKLRDEDKSDTKGEYALYIEGLTADDAQREEIFNKLISCEGYSFTEQRGLIRGFSSCHIPEERRRLYFDRYFEHLLEINSNKKNQYYQNWLHYLFPSSTDKKYIIEKINELILKVPENKKTVRKELLQKLDGEERLCKIFGIEI